jgi:hypothetical protein
MIELTVPLAAESLLDLRLRMRAREVSAAGKVIWSRSGRMSVSGEGSFQHGIEFVGIRPDQRAAIESLMTAEGGATA